MKKEDHIISGTKVRGCGYYYRNRRTPLWVNVEGSNLGTGDHWYNGKDHMYIKMDPDLLTKLLDGVNLRVRKKRTWYYVVGVEPRKE